MYIENNNPTDIIMDLNIPFKVYFILFILIIIIIALKHFFSKEELFDFIENKNKKSEGESNGNDKLNLLTKLNTKINRDYLDNSKYYNEIGYFKIYGCQKENNTTNGNKTHKNNNESKDSKKKIIITKNRKVGFSNNILYENENENINNLDY